MADRKPAGAMIVTPNSLHSRHSLIVIENKIPLFVEKPISSDFKCALSIVQYAQKENVRLMTGHHRRHNRIAAVAKKKIDSGQLGRLVASHSMCWLFKPETYFSVWRRVIGVDQYLLI